MTRDQWEDRFEGIFRALRGILTPAQLREMSDDLWGPLIDDRLSGRNTWPQKADAVASALCDALHHAVSDPE